ncbi:MAG: YkgJ family cysteine cluster protein [Acidobacteriaceae bacterium]|nr:YkgJ family cysteine cluster protein [Acidobacteriaceae bacterium]
MDALFRLIDNALHDAAQRSGKELACHPGCHQCCIGVFPISALDAVTLREGLQNAPQKTRTRIQERAAASRERLLAEGFPGDAESGVLFTEEEHEEQFEEFANEEVCPALDPISGTCELYAYRPVQCRTFGPPVRDEEGALTVCELCFTEAPAEEIARCEMDQSWRQREQEAILSLDPEDRPTLVAFALR